MTTQRIKRIRDRYQRGAAHISVERARYYTESWRTTEGLSPRLRIAMAMRHVYERMTHLVDIDDRIAGHWTEHYLGVPIDIERGVFNGVLEAELSKWTIINNRATSMGKSLIYLTRKRAIGEFLHNQSVARQGGHAPLDLSVQTMQERAINSFQIERGCRKELTRELLPYWRGKTLADRLHEALAAAGANSNAMRDLCAGMPGNTSRQVSMIASCATVATIQGHVILDYERVLDRGLEGMMDDLAEASRREPLSDEQKDALSSFRVSLEGVSIFARRLTEALERELHSAVDPSRVAVLREMLATCRRVPMKPAETFREAVQSIWTIKTAVEIAHPMNLHCFGRLDQTLYPFYRADLNAGRITPDDARELIEELLLKLMSQNLRPESNVLSNFYHRFFGSTPVTLAGQTRTGEDACNELTYIFLEAAHGSKAVTNVSVRISPRSPDRLLLELADYLHDGTSSFSLFNDETNIEAMTRRGFALADARDYAIMGCVETTCPGKTGSLSASALLLSRVLDITLRAGDSRTLAGTLKGDGLNTGDPDTFDTFEDLVRAFLKQARYFIAKIVRASELRDQLFAEMLPAPMISAFMDGCLDKAADVTEGGAIYDLTGISLVNSIANLTDSLYVIKKLIFERRLFDFSTLLAAIDANFVGYDDVGKAIRETRGKWGNGNPESDAIAERIMRELCTESHKHLSPTGQEVVTFAISMTTHTIDGRLSIASPDGRRAATPYAASGNPYNVERAGVTGALRSVAALPHEELMGCAVNMRFHPSGIGHDRRSRAKWASLVRTYFELGGAQLQPTVASAETLRRAQQVPDDYRDLIIKVGGYSTYFVDLGTEIQDEIIARTEHA